MQNVNPSKRGSFICKAATGGAKILHKGVSSGNIIVEGKSEIGIIIISGAGYCWKEDQLFKLLLYYVNGVGKIFF